MSDKKIDVTLRYRDQFSAGFQASIALLSKGTKEAQKAWKSVQQTGDSIAKVGGSITKTISVPIAAMGAAGVKNFSSVDKQLRLVQATMGSTAEEAAQLEKSIKTSASNSVFSMQDSADATLNFARQGFKAAEAADMLTPALDLAAGTATDLSTVTSGLGNTMKAFGASSSEAAHYTDMMAKAQAQANTDVTGLFDAMSVAGATANTVGWNFADLATLTGVFGDKSISASEGATALNTGLMRMASGSSREAMKELGIEVFNTNGTMKSMPETIGALQKGFAGLSAQEQLAAASSIFGKNQAAKWLTLINGPGVESLESMKLSIEGATGASHDMAEALLSGPGGSIEKLKSSIDVLTYSIGDLLSKYVQPVIDKANELVTAFNEMDPAQQEQIVKWGLIAAAVGPTIMVFGKLVSTVGTVGLAVSKAVGTANRLYKGFKALSAGAKVAQVGLAGLMSPAAVVIAVIAAVALVVAAVVTHFDTFKKTLAHFSPVFQHMQESLARLRERFEPILQVVIEVGKVVWDVFGEGLGIIFGTAAAVVASYIDYIAKTIDSLILAGQGVVDFLTGVFTGDWDKAWNGLKEIFQGAWGYITAPVEAFIGLLDRVVAGIEKVIGKAASVNPVSLSLPDNARDGLNAVSRGVPIARRGYGGVPMRARGDANFFGGLVQVHERGGEIIDLPHGTRIYPHDQSVAMARREGGGVTIPKIADQIIVREDADIDRIGEAIARALARAGKNRGTV
nr:MAG TPA: minor tail protein [Caudoviricetes sp.]